MSTWLICIIIAVGYLLIARAVAYMAELDGKSEGLALKMGLGWPLFVLVLMASTPLWLVRGLWRVFKRWRAKWLRSLFRPTFYSRPGRWSWDDHDAWTGKPGGEPGCGCPTEDSNVILVPGTHIENPSDPAWRSPLLWSISMMRGTKLGWPDVHVGKIGRGEDAEAR